MLDLAKFSEVENERNIWEQPVPAVHGTEQLVPVVDGTEQPVPAVDGTESGTMFFLSVQYISSICKPIT
jgi:hypothetical protein